MPLTVGKRHLVSSSDEPLKSSKKSVALNALPLNNSHVTSARNTVLLIAAKGNLFIIIYFKVVLMQHIYKCGGRRVTPQLLRRASPSKAAKPDINSHTAPGSGTEDTEVLILS